MRRTILTLVALIGLGIASQASANTIVTIAFTGLDVDVSFDGTNTIVDSGGEDLLDTLSLRVDNVLVYASALTDTIDTILVAPGPLPAGSGSVAVGFFDVFINGLGAFIQSNTFGIALFHDALSLSGIDGLATVFNTNIFNVVDPVAMTFSSSVVPAGTDFSAVLSGEITFLVVPEPSSVALAGSGLVAIVAGGVYTRRRRINAVA